MAEIDKLKEKRAAERKKLTLLRSPVRTLRLFAEVVIDAIRFYTLAIVRHRLFGAGVFLFLTYLVVDRIPGWHQAWISEMETSVLWAVWWLGLGILSSVGLGTGMHTGLLFLFPHIFEVCLAAAACKSTNFDSRAHMWFMNSAQGFLCLDAAVPAGESSVGFFDVFMKVFWPCLVWGTGTAMGEIPPYAVSRAARLAGKANEEFEDITHSHSAWAVLDRMKLWMVDFLQRHGFLGVLLMSAWPNMAFDLCGICCGHFLMPFWEFFLATFIGKAIIKVNMQACFFIMLFTQEHLAGFVAAVERLVPDHLDPCLRLGSKACHLLVQDLLHDAQSKFHRVGAATGTEEESWGKRGWSVVMFLFIGFFIVSCIEQFAQNRAAEIDAREIEQLQKLAKD